MWRLLIWNRYVELEEKKMIMEFIISILDKIFYKVDSSY